MVVIVVFERPYNQYIRKNYPCIFRDAFLIVASGARVAWYDTGPTEVFASRNVDEYELDGGAFQFVVLNTTPEEDEIILRTCDACCQCHIEYSLLDQFLRGVPFWTPADCSLFHSQKMYGAQSVVLILRECLSQTNPLLPVLMALNSRTISAMKLKTELSVFSQPIPADRVRQLFGTCRADAVSRPSRV